MTDTFLETKDTMDITAINLKKMQELKPIEQMMLNAQCFAVALGQLIPDGKGIVVEVPYNEAHPNNVYGKIAVIHYEGQLHLDPTVDQSFPVGAGLSLNIHPTGESEHPADAPMNTEEATENLNEAQEVTPVIH